jgi:hypothetical protein
MPPQESKPMRRVALRVGAAFALGSALVGLPALADDAKNPSESKSSLETQKRPDFTGYVYVADVVGEVVKADDKHVTFRVTWMQPVAKKGSNNNRGRPNLSRNHRNFHNPYMPNRNTQSRVQYKQQHHDYTLDFLPQSLVRTKILPPKTDENGKRVSYTQKELDELRQPAGVTGYVAGTFDLTPGTIVELILIRDKNIPAEKSAESDLRVKYAIIWGKDPNPPKDITNQKPAVNKNNKKKN